MTKENIVKNILLFLGCLASVIVVVLLVQWFSNNLGEFFNGKLSGKSFFSASLEANASETFVANEITEATIVKDFLPVKTWQEGDLVVDSESAILAEISGEGYSVLFEKNKLEKLPIASLTKLMTALIVLERYDLNQRVLINSKVMAQVGEQGGLREGQIFSVKDLLYMMLIESSNRSAYALSQIMGVHNFIEAMNSRAMELGMARTHFSDSSGLDSASYSTSEDLVKLSKYLFERYPLFNEIIAQREFNLYLDSGSFHHTLINTNGLLGEIPSIVGGKTGFTNEAKGCLMVIQKNERDNNYLVYVVLGAEDRFGQVKKMINWVQSPYQF